MAGADGGRGPRVRWLLAVPVALIQIFGTLGAGWHGQSGRLTPDVLAAVLVLVGPVALAIPGRHVLTAIIAVAAASAYVAIGYVFGPIVLSAAIALVIAIQAGRRSEAWLIAAAGWVAALLLSRLGVRPLPIMSGLGFAIWAAVLLALAEAVRGRREAAAVWARARAEERRRQAGEERLQIARDLHDGVAHQISLISVRAGVALHLLDGGGRAAAEEARAALAAIRDASGEALTELRSALALLRAEDEPAPRSPAPGLGGLGALADQWDGAGLLVAVTGTPGPLPSAVDQAAYRVVQEALTNVSQHSVATRADIDLTRDGEQLIVTVVDPGPARRTGRDRSGPDEDAVPDDLVLAATSGGRGLVGMRERVAALGGAVVAGPLPQPGTEGWRVRAVLPVRPPGLWPAAAGAPGEAAEAERAGERA